MAETRLGYRPALDGVRGIAIACVVLFHEFSRPYGGLLGVDLFFVLSGFLITTLLLEEHARTGTASFRGFYMRRIRRLLPALAVMLIIYVALTVGIAAGTHNWENVNRALVGVAAACGFSMNFVLEGRHDLSQVIEPSLVPLWSLATEEQFYLLWPPILFLLLRGRRVPAVILLTTMFGLVILRNLQLFADPATPQYRLQFGPDTRSGGILIGCLIGIAYTSRARATMLRWARLLAPLAALGLLWLIVQPPPGLFDGPIAAFWLCAALLIVAASQDSYLGSVLAARPLVALGKISYSLYIWHEVISYTVFRLNEGEPTPTMKLAAIAVSVITATLSYRFVEQRFIRRRASDTRANSTRAALAVAA